MSVQIIVDSASDITKQEAESMGLVFLPLTTRIDGVEYKDGVTISHDEFYEKLKKCSQLPSTSQLTPYDFEQAIREAVERGDDALIITLSAKLSGTARSAQIAAADFPGRVWVVDSENVTLGERVLVEYAVSLRDEGLSAPELVERLERVKPRVCVIGLVDTLEYLVKGGRLSKTTAIAGTILNIKPALTVKDGKLAVLGKARGYKQSHNMLNETIRKRGGVDFSMPYVVAHSGGDETLLQNYIDSSRSIWEDKAESIPVATIGSTIGTYVGPNAIAVAFFTGEAE